MCWTCASQGREVPLFTDRTTLSSGKFARDDQAGLDVRLISCSQLQLYVRQLLHLLRPGFFLSFYRSLSVCLFRRSFVIFLRHIFRKKHSADCRPPSRRFPRADRAAQARGDCGDDCCSPLRLDCFLGRAPGWRDRILACRHKLLVSHLLDNFRLHGLCAGLRSDSSTELREWCLSTEATILQGPVCWQISSACCL